MIEFLFGWVTKGEANISFMDRLVCSIEIAIIFLMVMAVWYLILFLKRK